MCFYTVKTNTTMKSIKTKTTLEKKEKENEFGDVKLMLSIPTDYSQPLLWVRRFPSSQVTVMAIVKPDGVASGLWDLWGGCLLLVIPEKSCFTLTKKVKSMWKKNASKQSYKTSWITVVLRRCKKRKVTKFSKKMVDEVNVSKAYKTAKYWEEQTLKCSSRAWSKASLQNQDQNTRETEYHWIKTITKQGS